MILTDKGGGDWEQPPTGLHVARSIGLIDIGTQKGEYQGQPTIKRQFILKWELPNELMTRGEQAGMPFVVSKFYTASLSEKSTLRKDLEAWRGKEFTKEELAGFDSKAILDKPCMIQISEKNGRNKVTAVTCLAKGTPVPPAVNRLQWFSLDEFDEAMFQSFSEKLQEMIRKSPEYKSAVSMMVGGDPSTQFDDLEDAPF